MIHACIYPATLDLQGRTWHKHADACVGVRAVRSCVAAAAVVAQCAVQLGSGAQRHVARGESSGPWPCARPTAVCRRQVRHVAALESQQPPGMLAICTNLSLFMLSMPSKPSVYMLRSSIVKLVHTAGTQNMLRLIS